METIFILYVADQEASKTFYEKILAKAPCLHVPGMTEFQLSPLSKLGLMPEKGIAKIISPPLPAPETGQGVPRCELYFQVENPEKQAQIALEHGAQEVDPLKNRDWGDAAVYLSDPDGHVLAFARRL